MEGYTDGMIESVSLSLSLSQAKQDQEGLPEEKEEWGVGGDISDSERYLNKAKKELARPGKEARRKCLCSG